MIFDTRKLLAVCAVAFCAALVSAPAHATKIQRVVSAGGIEAWLVQDSSVPLIAMEFAFAGGAAQDPAGKPGTANLVANVIDEGAGELDSKAFHESLERRAIELAFRTSRDYFRGSIKTLTENRDEAANLLRLALTVPRFDAEALERVRAQTMSTLQRASTSPDDLSSLAWTKSAFGDHPYGQPSMGTLASVPTITADDLKDYVKRVLARDRLKIAVVGDISADDLKSLLDKIFGALPATGSLTAIPKIEPRIGKEIDISLNVPQAAIVYGAGGLKRDDADFMTAYVDNFILGGGTFSSRLYREVREKRGLVYGVSQNLIWYENSAIYFGSTATRADKARETIDVIQKEIQKFAAEGPTQKELDEAKSYLKGSQMLSLDTSSKIASQLVQFQIDNLGIDYIDKRNSLIDAVTLADAKRVAARLFKSDILITLAGPDASAAPKGN